MGEQSTQGDLSATDRWLDALEPVEDRSCLGVAIAWCLSDPARIGEVALLPDRQPRVLGRGPSATASFVRRRPGSDQPTPPLSGRLLSRQQLELTAHGDRIRLRNLGACALKIGGVQVQAAELAVGGVLELDRQLVLIVVRCPPLPRLPDPGPFGRPDASGLVGEGAAAWALRARLHFAARRADPVLVLGESGTGKELAACAIHAQGPRPAGPFVARNAATLPEGLVDAELFGNVRGYPNPGTPERPGLIGAAHGGTLFLDELGELPEPLQAHLLRVLDAGGEYQRLGEARPRRSDFRCVGATNRDPSELKHDLVARMPLTVELPPLTERPEDVPLLIRHLLTEAHGDPLLADRFFEGEHARLAPDLLEALLTHRWTHHVRELKAILWCALETSPGRALVRTPQVDAQLAPQPTVPAPDAPTPAAIAAALEEAGGSVTRAARALGLSSRYALYRLMKKHGLS